MVTWNEADELRRDALGKEIALRRFQERERKVRRDFWATLRLETRAEGPLTHFASIDGPHVRVEGCPSSSHALLNLAKSA
jgi:hypothetical protein